MRLSSGCWGKPLAAQASQSHRHAAAAAVLLALRDTAVVLHAASKQAVVVRKLCQHTHSCALPSMVRSSSTTR